MSEYLTAEERITGLALIDTYLSHFEQSRTLLHRKAGILKLSMVALAASAACTALEQIVVGSWPTKQPPLPDSPPNTPPPPPRPDPALTDYLERGGLRRDRIKIRRR